MTEHTPEEERQHGETPMQFRVRSHLETVAERDRLREVVDEFMSAVESLGLDAVDWAELVVVYQHAGDAIERAKESK